MTEKGCVFEHMQLSFPGHCIHPVAIDMIATSNPNNYDPTEWTTLRLSSISGGHPPLPPQYSFLVPGLLDTFVFTRQEGRGGVGVVGVGGGEIGENKSLNLSR